MGFGYTFRLGQHQHSFDIYHIYVNEARTECI